MAFWRSSRYRQTGNARGFTTGLSLSVCSPDGSSCIETVAFTCTTPPRSVSNSHTSPRTTRQSDVDFSLRVRLERALTDNADLYQQMEFGKRERLLASAEIEGLKKYHFKEMHALQDQLLAQRAAVAKLTVQLQDALQDSHISTNLHDEMTTMRQSHGISMKRLQNLVTGQDEAMKQLQAERDELAQQLRFHKENQDGDVTGHVAHLEGFIEHLRGQHQQEMHSLQQVHTEALHRLQSEAAAQVEANAFKAEEESQVQQLKTLLAAHESELRVVQEAAQSAQLALTAAQSEAQKRQADLHASHSQELMKLHETHSADLRRLSAIQAEASQISHLLESSNDLSRHPQDLSPEELDAVLAERGEVAVSHAELNDLRSLAAHGADSAELAEETANLISLLHQARSSNAQLRKERDRLRYKMSLFKKTLSNELLTMQLPGNRSQ